MSNLTNFVLSCCLIFPPTTESLIVVLFICKQASFKSAASPWPEVTRISTKSGPADIDDSPKKPFPLPSSTPSSTPSLSPTKKKKLHPVIREEGVPCSIRVRRQHRESGRLLRRFQLSRRRPKRTNMFGKIQVKLQTPFYISFHGFKLVQKSKPSS